jgi:sugar phosphate isomerase/epimerase
MVSRREFLVHSAAAPALAAAPGRGEVSLAAWSLVKSYTFSRRWANLDLPRIAREEFGLGALELVSLFFDNPTFVYLRQLRQNAEKHGVRLVRIMVDDEGNMSAVDKAERMQASLAHRRWIDAAHYLGCTDIRANMRGGLPEWKKDKDLVKRGAESFRHLLEYARAANIEVIVETHGGASSDPGILTSLVKEVNDPAFGILVDLINISREVDYEQGLRQLLPFAKGISVHPVWAREGSDPGFPIERALSICMEAGFRGYWGVESSFGPSLRVMPRFAPGQTAPLPLPPGVTEEQLWLDDLKGVRLTQAILARTVFEKR